MEIPDAPMLTYLCRIKAQVASTCSLGGGVHGERRFVPIIGGVVEGPALAGDIVSGGVDWQTLRADGTLDIAAHYVIRAGDGALIEVSSKGYRHAPPDVARRLAAGESVAPDEYYFRTAINFQTGAQQWQHLNSVVAIGKGQRAPSMAVIDVFLVG